MRGGFGSLSGAKTAQWLLLDSDAANVVINRVNDIAIFSKAGPDSRLVIVVMAEGGCRPVHRRPRLGFDAVLLA
jgi:hypothetical protein